jgi:3-oxoadipate CoA-transferase, alpha subunit
MLDKRVASVQDALAGVQSGMTVAVGGFGGAGFPRTLVDGLARADLRDLTLVSNNATRLESLIRREAVARIICSYPFSGATREFRGLIRDQRIAIDLLPQGTLAEKLRAAGAGLGGALLRVGRGTEFATGRQTVEIDGEEFIVEPALRPDVSLVSARSADRWGNLHMRGSGQNFNVVMAMAATVTVAEAREIVPLGGLSPNECHVPSVFVNRVVHVAEHVSADQRGAAS